MGTRDLLSDEQITTGLLALPEWQREGGSIQRTVQAKDFPAAIRIVDAVAVQAEAMDHHPDIDIRWRTLHFTLSTHSAGGLTALDLRLASLIDAAAAAEA
ncbi:4a-hydroxytetrahydrobiopterin dehydratase [Streptacidiphilus jiangxiensis]|uniref:Putative pterin-4-alpha-carbinolamine dehydratase n=1 Tax=Streptacidiphilus jiangxiensis TaxID=235985 RepID=A0A1H7VUQ5_STRJI|nr:4a-hydroxytetrahydrobiopterin dehydratase [Streptacidiphilus jiangxiensis]SEM12966.1 4a-hydroxytetrahydrobiopterin dehydratase [Streptacidiphilus jiangxiensis]